MAWTAFDGSFIEVVQIKTGAKVPVPVPLHGGTAGVARSSAPKAAITILTGPVTAGHFRHPMTDAFKKAGAVIGRSSRQ